MHHDVDSMMVLFLHLGVLLTIPLFRNAWHPSSAVILPGVRSLRPRVSLMNSQHTGVEGSLPLGNVDRLELKAWVNASQAELNGGCRKS